MSFVDIIDIVTELGEGWWLLCHPLFELGKFVCVNAFSVPHQYLKHRSHRHVIYAPIARIFPRTTSHTISYAASTKNHNIEYSQEEVIGCKIDTNHQLSALRMPLGPRLHGVKRNWSVFPPRDGGVSFASSSSCSFAIRCRFVVSDSRRIGSTSLCRRFRSIAGSCRLAMEVSKRYTNALVILANPGKVLLARG